MKYKHKFFFKGGSNNYDEEYNARIATIAEQQQEMSKTYFDFWKSDYKPMEQSQIRANMQLIPRETEYNLASIAAQKQLLPGQTELSQAEIDAALRLYPKQTEFAEAQIASALRLLPQQTELEETQIADTMTGIREKAPVRSKFYNESLEGIDLESRANKAAADASHAFMNSNNIMRRNTARMGVNPNSGRFASLANNNSINQAKTVAGAKTKARTQAENENYSRLATAMGGY